MTDTHETVRARTAAFVRDHLNPYVPEWEAVGAMPLREIVAGFAAAGLSGVSRAPDVGGDGLDFSHAMVVAEALGDTDCGAVQMALGVHAVFALGALERFGTPVLRQRHLAPAIRGELVASLAITEREAGSDVAAIRTTARRSSSGWILDGEKAWVANATQADFAVVLAVSAPGERRNAHSLFVVPLDLPGVTRSAPERTLGMHAAECCTLRFDGVRIPRDHLIGEEGHGFRHQMSSFDEERLWAAANTLRTLERCIERTVEHVRGRIAFGRPLFDQQSVQFRLAELATEVAALRALTFSAGARHVAGGMVTQQAAMAKLKAGRLMREVADSCLQYWGGEGYRWDNPVSRLYRDGRLASIGGGADEVMLTLIARQL